MMFTFGTMMKLTTVALISCAYFAGVSIADFRHSIDFIRFIQEFISPICIQVSTHETLSYDDGTRLAFMLLSMSQSSPEARFVYVYNCEFHGHYFE